MQDTEDRMEFPTIVDSLDDNSKWRKDRWKILILKQIFSEPGITRKQLSVKLSVRSETVSLAVAEFIKDGLVTEGSLVLGKPGRPEVELLPRGDRIVGVSFYIEDYDVVMGVLNLQNENLLADRYTLSPDTSNKDFTKVIEKFLKDIRRKLPSGSEIAGIGFSLIGAVDHERKIWISTARWANIKKLDLSILEESLQVPISVQRSLDAELEYIMALRPDLRQGNAMLFHWGLGVGSAFAYKGMIIRSTFGRFGDVGHTPVIKDNAKRCMCGLYGCLETEAALWALKKPIQEAIGGFDDAGPSFPEIIKDSRLALIPAVDKAVEYIANGLLTAFHLFFPDHIVLIGRFVENQDICSKLENLFLFKLSAENRDSVRLIVDHSAFEGVLYTSCTALMVRALSRYSRFYDS